MYILGVDETTVYTSTDTQFPQDLGTIGFKGNAALGYQFVRANGALVIGDVVGIDENYDATQVTTTTSAPAAGQGLPVGVVVATLADNEYGWVQVKGLVGSINVATSCAVHTELNSTATGGRIDDDATAGAEVIAGLTTTAAESSNLAAGVANFPYISRTL